MKMKLRRYKWLFGIGLINVLLVVADRDIGFRSIQVSLDNLEEMLVVIPPIFVLLGLLDVWVERETMIKLMGEKSGWLGVSIAFVMGSFAAGPLYAAFPIAGVLLKKGSKFSNILIFIGAWSTTKIPLLLFEASSMGWKFTLVRLALDLPGIMLIAFIIEKLLTFREKAIIYERALAL